MQTLSFVPINLHIDAGRLSENTVYCCMMNYSQTITAENSAQNYFTASREEGSFD